MTSTTLTSIDRAEAQLLYASQDATTFMRAIEAAEKYGHRPNTLAEETERLGLIYAARRVMLRLLPREVDAILEAYGYAREDLLMLRIGAPPLEVRTGARERRL